MISWLIVLVGVAASEPYGTGAERHQAIYPPQDLPLRFDHAQHLSAGADCTTCHDSARGSTRSRDLNLPAHPECESCHDIQAAARGKRVDPPAGCRDCHPGFDRTVRRDPARLVLPAPNLIFNHRVHVDRKIECTSCHGTMTDVQLATRMQLPKMAACLTCHDGSTASAECSTCHVKDTSGRVKLTFSSGLLRPMKGNPLGMDHGPRFEFTHGNRAATSQATCLACHGMAECQHCHDSLQKPLSVHPNDFITLHPLQARMDVTRCDACHRRQSFCAACHERVGVGMETAPQLRPLNVRVHPNYFEWVETPGPKHHGIVAARDIGQCTACHREQSCLPCHSEAGMPTSIRSVNPHPAGFAAMCKTVASKNDRACLKCHSPSTLQELGCR